MGSDRFDDLDWMSLAELRALNRAEAGRDAFAEECFRAGVADVEARSPRGLLAALTSQGADPMDIDPLIDDDTPRDRYWGQAEARMNGVG